MALNLMTPRYVAPDVTKAPLAGEAIRSSQASTNLAARAQATRDRAQQAQEQQFGAELGLRSKEQAEASAARRGNLALGWERADQGWEELGLRAEAQSVNLANTEQQMRHREDKLPLEIRGLGLANEAQDLKNELDDATLADQIAKVGLGNQNLQADINGKRASANSITQATNFAAANQGTKLRQEANLADYQSQMDAAINLGRYDFIQDMVFEDVNPAQAQSLRNMQVQIAGREASKAALASTNRIHVDAINQSTDTQAVIDKLPNLGMKGFWRQPNQTNFNGSITYVNGDGELTAEGHAALDAQQEWLSLASKTTNINQLWTMPVGSATGQGWLHSGNSAGEKFLNGKMFIPTEDALVEARLLNAQQKAAFQANITPTEFEYEKHGVKVKGKSIAVMDKESQQAHMDSVAGKFKELLATDEYTGADGHLKAWAKAVLESKTDMGKIAFIAPSDFAAFNKVKGGEMYFDAQSLGYKIKPHAKTGTGGPPTPPTTATPDFDPLPDDYDGPKSDVYDKRKTLNHELTSNGMPQWLASWTIKIGADTSMMKDDWNTDDDLVGLVVQARRRTQDMKKDQHAKIAAAAFGTSWTEADATPEHFTDADIMKLAKHLDKPISQWPKGLGQTAKLDRRDKPNVQHYSIESAALLRKHIPLYLSYKSAEEKLEAHSFLPAYKGHSKEY